MNVENVKEKVLLAGIILLLLFALCFVMYTQWNKESVVITTNIEFAGGVDALSQELQNIIPYVTTNNTEYKTAYQNTSVDIDDIHNDILLTKGYFNNNVTTFAAGDLLTSLREMYGNNVFVMHDSFNVNGKNSCEYQDYVYTCSEVDYSGILYKADRVISNVNINDTKVYLTEDIIFYSEEVIEDVTYYQVFNNGLYTEVTNTFTSNDLNSVELTLEEYFSEYLSTYRVSYISSFTIDNTNYIWIGTEIL